MTDFAFEIIQFRIPRAVGEAIDLTTINQRARDAGVDDPKLEYNTKDVRRGGYRITCRRPIAVFLCEEVKRVMKTAEGPLVLDCGEAVMAILKALEPAPRNNGT